MKTPSNRVRMNESRDVNSVILVHRLQQRRRQRRKIDLFKKSKLVTRTAIPFRLSLAIQLAAEPEFLPCNLLNQAALRILFLYLKRAPDGAKLCRHFKADSKITEKQ